MTKLSWVFMLIISSGILAMANDHVANDHAAVHSEHATASPHAAVSEHVSVTEHSPTTKHVSPTKHTAASEHSSVAPHGPGFWQRLFQNNSLTRFYFDLETKLARAARVDQENEQLRRRVAVLELALAKSVEHSLRSHEEKRAEVIKFQAKEEGGVETARTIASLNMADEELLSRPLAMVFAEAAKSFSSDDYETAGKAFSFLVDNSDNETYQNAQTYYLAGVSLYKVGNYRRSIAYLEKAEKHANGEAISYGPRALGWIALCQKKLGNRAAEKKAIHELFQKYPKSKEARRLNRNA